MLTYKARAVASEMPKRILIVRTDRLGDVVLTLPMAGAIKSAETDTEVFFLARSYTAPILERSPSVDKVLIVGVSASILEAIRTFRQSHADVAFFPSPRFSLALAAFLAGVSVRVGTGYRWYSLLFNRRVYEHRRTAERHEAAYNLRMLSHAGIRASEDEQPKLLLRKVEVDAVDSWLTTELGGGSKFAILHVTIGGSSHPWPIEFYVELGRKIAKQFHMAIILTGLSEEAEGLRSIALAIGSEHARVFAGHPLPELAALLQRAELVIAASTGPGHLAAALGTNTIGLFPLPTPLSKERWGFRGRRVSNISPEAIAECPNCVNCTCMERLNVQIVWKAVESAIVARQPAA